MTALARAGALDRRGIDLARMGARARRRAQADGSVGRILDGHYNAVERIELLAPRAAAQRPPRGGRCRPAAGWASGAPTRRPARASPRACVRVGDELTLEGVKTFCSGAGGLHGALVVARDGDARRVAYVDLAEGVEIDRTWFAAAGMRASESHLVRFHGARVHALLGGPDELLREPVVRARRHPHGRELGRHRRCRPRRGAEALAPRALAGDDLAALAVGRIDTHAQTIDLWLAEAGRRADAHPDASMRALLVHLREAVARAAQAIVDEALARRRVAPAGARRRARPRGARPAHLPAPAPPRPAARARRTRGGRPVTLTREHFEARYAADPDPWDFESERLRARRSTSARWPRSASAATARAFEAGCSIGVFTALLADRCDELLAVDIAQSRRRRRARAPRRAHPRARRAPHAARGSGPPARSTSSSARSSSTTGTARRSKPRCPRSWTSLAPGGRLVAVHFRPPSSIDPLTGDVVHALLRERLGRSRTSRRTPTTHFLLDVFDA